MFRLSRYIRALNVSSAKAARPAGGKPMGPVVIWNLTRRCNLTCKHCYAFAANGVFPNELSTAEAFAVVDDLATMNLPMLILSGGEPLLRDDLFDIARYASGAGIPLTLSTNGCLVDENIAARVKEIGFSYVGISLDGIGATHDAFRGAAGAFDEALRGIRYCLAAGLNTGIRMTLTQDNAAQLPQVIQLAKNEGVSKFYLSHLNYAGRGHLNRKSDLFHHMARETMDFLIAEALAADAAGQALEFVTGNNDADGAYFLLWVQKNRPDRFAEIHRMLQRWGGNATGVGVANIDNEGRVHPDTMWWNHTLGNVKEEAFSSIWQTTTDPLMAQLRAKPRPLEGRCAACPCLSLCNGNTRTRAFRTFGNAMAEDPGCYLSDEELLQFADLIDTEVPHAVAYH